MGVLETAGRRSSSSERDRDVVERKKKQSGGAKVHANGHAPKILTPEVVEIDSLRDHPRNYREHPDDQLQHLQKSLRRFGVYRNVVAAKDGTILAGHGVVKAARRAGLRKIPIIRLNLAPDSPSALKVLVGDNEIEHLAEQNDRLLSDLLKDIRSGDRDALAGTGFDDKMLAAFMMVTRPENEIKDFDAAMHWVGVPEFELGDKVFILAIKCDSEKDRDALVRKIKLADKHIRKQGKAWTTWWPQRARDDVLSVRVEQE